MKDELYVFEVKLEAEQISHNFFTLYLHYTCMTRMLVCLFNFIIYYNIDRTLHTLWLVKNPCFIKVQNIEKACFIV